MSWKFPSWCFLWLDVVFGWCLLVSRLNKSCFATSLTPTCPQFLPPCHLKCQGFSQVCCPWAPGPSIFTFVIRLAKSFLSDLITWAPGRTFSRSDNKTFTVNCFLSSGHFHSTIKPTGDHWKIWTFVTFSKPLMIFEHGPRPNPNRKHFLVALKS